MDWLKLFAFLVAATMGVLAEVPLKKIRIHLPQKVKHIHHHKKIYITNHSASPQYAPAYIPGSESASAMANNVVVPADPNFTPLDSVEPYEDIRARQPLYTAPVSKMLPLYRARGYYGPLPSEWDEEDQYDINTPAEPIDTITPTGIESGPATFLPKYLSKNPKLAKVKEQTRKKATPKNNTKQVVIKGKPIQEEEHPVSTFHKKFYADIQGVGMIRKIKKPQRVEKIIDGDTEHIHTYSEEHIHKLVFDDGAKITGMPSDDTANNIAVLAGSRPSIPIKNSHSLIALPSNPLTGFAFGPMESPEDLEYAAYNPHEVTHDHIFHDHGEILTDIDMTKNPLLYPPKVSYNSKGVRIGIGPIDNQLKYQNKYIKSTKTTPVADINYQENVPYQYTKNRNSYKNNAAYYDTSPQNVYNDFKPIAYFNFKENRNLKSSGLVPSLYFDNEPTQQTSVPTPFAVSSTVIHDYTPKRYSEGVTPSAAYSKFKDPLLNHKNSYASNLEYDTYAASSNFYPTAESSDEFIPSFLGREGAQKSASNQNDNYLGLENNNNVDHADFYTGRFSSVSNNQNSFTGIHNNNEYDEVKHSDVISLTPTNSKESSSAYSYYSAMAIKALHDEEQQQESRQTSSTTPYTPPVGTKTSMNSEHYDAMNIDSVSTPSPNHIFEQKHRHRNKNTRGSNAQHKLIDYRRPNRALGKNSKIVNTFKYLHEQSDESSSPSSRLKYGDKLNS